MRKINYCITNPQHSFLQFYKHLLVLHSSRSRASLRHQGLFLNLLEQRPLILHLGHEIKFKLTKSEYFLSPWENSEPI